MITSIYPGTFDPITNGHIDIATRAAGLFDKTLVAVAAGTSKPTFFTINERTAMATAVLSNLNNVVVVSFNGLTTDFAAQQGAKVIVRGIRAVSDFDYEFQMAGMNRQLIADIETVFLTPSEDLGYITSSLVRTIAAFSGHVDKFVHPVVTTALQAKFS